MRSASQRFHRWMTQRELHERMYKLRTLLRALSRDRLFSVIAFLFLSVQTAGVVHALDLDAHEGGAPCHLCQVHDRQGSAPPPAIQSVSFDPPSAPVLEAPAVSRREPTRHLLPPSRGPPAR
jgi:hypothetical protein